MIPSALAQYDQFIIHRNKTPIDYKTGKPADPHDPTIWISLQAAQLTGEEIGFVFTDKDPFFFIDIDHCRTDTGWSDTANCILRMFPGAYIELSRSNTGLHIIGSYSGTEPEHSCKNTELDIELYTSKRYCALTGNGAYGDASAVFNLTPVISLYFRPRITDATLEWDAGPVPGWKGITDDDELIQLFLGSTGGAQIFGGCSIASLFLGDVDAIAARYPDHTGARSYDASSADAALAQHLAFWTGKDPARIHRLMLRSNLVREKWDREDYLQRTILNAVANQEKIYGYAPPVAEDITPLKSKSDRQRQFAEKTRAEVLATVTDVETRAALIQTTGPLAQASFWLNNRGKTAAELLTASKPVSAPDPVITQSVQRVSGVRYLTADSQLEHFKGCVYVQDLHKIFTPRGALLKPDQFNAMYGGYMFQLDELGEKTTKKAWEVFTESHVLKFPKVEQVCFKPDMPTGSIITKDNQTMVNTFIPINTERKIGDPKPFLDHLAKLLPDENDRAIILSYMAAIVQYPGKKFYWAPLIQGVEGNGKTLITRCLCHAVGHRYTHKPKAAEIANKFNGWILNKILIAVEDVFTQDKLEVIETLKPMITNEDGLEIQFKGADQFTADVCANFILNTNHKDALRKTRNDRRFAVFYTAQQQFSDLTEQGMGGSYFPDLYHWLNNEGYAIVNELLNTYPIPEHLNPATECHRAPVTSSTDEAVVSSRGGIEQDIIEAIEESRVGFSGNWISSMALDKLLHEKRASRFITRAKRRLILNELGYIWHPNLPGGRASRHVITDGGRPRLYVKEGSIYAQLTDKNEIIRAYEREQEKVEGGVFQDEQPNKGFI